MQILRLMIVDFAINWLFFLRGLVCCVLAVMVDVACVAAAVQVSLVVATVILGFMAALVAAVLAVVAAAL